MTKLWDPESPSVRLAIVCYADILGFRAQTRDAFASGTGEDFLRRIKTSLKKAYDIVRRANDPCPDVSPLFEMKVFTDNIVVAYPLHDPVRDDGEGELGTIMMLFAQVQASLASEDSFSGARLPMVNTTRMTMLLTEWPFWKPLVWRSRGEHPGW